MLTSPWVTMMVNLGGTMTNALYLYGLVLLFFSLLMSEVHLATLNVNGSRDARKRVMVYEIIKQRNISVAFLQETHSDQKNAADWGREFDGVSVLSHNSSVSGGVAILFNRNFVPISYDVDEIVKGRLLKVRACFENHVFVFMCVYAPAAPLERMLFLDTLCLSLQNCCSEEFLFLGGDFNCTELNLDRNHMEPHLASRKRLIHTIKKYDLCDVWRSLNKDERQYTWAHSRDNVMSLARLDRFYCFKYHFSIFNRCYITPVGFTDHSMVHCIFIVSTVKPKSAYWHFNNNLLQDEFFKESFKFFWEAHRKTKPGFSSVQQWWDVGKVQIKQFTQQYTLNVTKELTRSLDFLEKEIIELESLAHSTGDPCFLEVYSKKKAQMSDLLGYKTQGALVRSRFQNIDQMDAPSKYFFNLEKKNGQKRLIHALCSENGVLLSDPAEIRQRAVLFYQDLYRSELKSGICKENSFLENLPKVSEEANGDLSKSLTLGELYKALQSMESGRAPGIDGLPVDFYKTFWVEMGVDLLEVLNDCLSKGRLPLSCRRAVITLLPKKGDLTDIRNWRPVSLLCNEYKLLSKALANRLAGVLDQVIHPDQTYCVPGRSIFDNISFIRDIFYVSKLLNINCGLVFLDQEKAFDRVEHSYLWSTLSAFGFCESFVDMIRVLYCDVESVLKINGGLCAPFRVLRGIRQGCSLSGMLYSLAIEPLLQQIRSKLCGLSLPVCDNKFYLSAYADDIVVLLNNQSDVHVLFNLFEDFKQLSSAKVNWKKSEAILLGQWAEGIPHLPAGLFWGRGGVKYLGVFLGDE
uniref:Reverse transcriptase domain-containing protein n=1 Tax=Cyprinus carpio TaxID=7962 RepID=A0A8C2GDM5_CYPCA